MFSQIDEWRGRSSRVLSLCEDIAQLHCSVVSGANRAVLYDLYPYVWDLRNTALVAKAFICWLGESTEKQETMGIQNNIMCLTVLYFYILCVVTIVILLLGCTILHYIAHTSSMLY